MHGNHSPSVVYLLIPTSNHNHQSTEKKRSWLYIFWFLHQTTTDEIVTACSGSCISFDSYIKPQRPDVFFHKVHVVYLLIPTSNHNHRGALLYACALYIFWFLHQTTTNESNDLNFGSCISFDSYIKPQLRVVWVVGDIVVYLLIPTSNHNNTKIENLEKSLYIFWFLHQTTTVCRTVLSTLLLYIFWFLHQTTTSKSQPWKGQLLYIFWFLHQTTTDVTTAMRHSSCISFDSYIKPQQSRR